MKPLDWLTIALVCLALVMVVAAILAKRRGGRPISGHPVRAALALFAATLVLQYFRGFDVTVDNVEFHSEGEGAVVTGTLHNPRTFKLNAIVVEVSGTAAGGEVIKTEKVFVKEIAAGDSSRFSAKLKTNAPIARVYVTAEGFWT